MIKLKLISSMAPREVLAAAIALYRSRRDTSDISIEAGAAGGVDVSRRIVAGEKVDIVVLSNDAIDKLIEGGQLSAENRIDLMSSPIAVAVRSGAPRPGLADEKAVQAAVVSAKTLSYSTGPSGRYLEKLFDRWGILASTRSRIVVPPPGVPVASLVASGKAELGFQQLSELLGADGVDVIGPLPPEIQYITNFTGALAIACANVAAARSFLLFLRSPDVESLRQRHGMTSVS
jgi:molybdate transport system substrate-binding protein